MPGVIDTSSVKEHSTGWKSWEHPFEIAALGAFKNAVMFHATTFLNMSNSIRFAAMAGASTELVSAQYCVTGKSVITKPWYGSFAVRYNIKAQSWEVPWVKFKGCGPEKRRMVELKRKDRLVFSNNPIPYSTKEDQIIPPFSLMEKFLSDYQIGFHFPEHNINKPFKIGSVTEFLK